MCYPEYSTGSGHLNDEDFNFFTDIDLFMVSLLNDTLINTHSQLILSLLFWLLGQILAGLPLFQTDNQHRLMAHMK